MAEKGRDYYLHELMSHTCACGRPKRGNQSFCPACYGILPVDIKRDLYDLIGQGYEEAVDAGIKFLREAGRW